MNESKKKSKLNKIVATLLAVSPILSPYLLFSAGSISLGLMDFLMVVIALIIIFGHKKINLPIKELVILLVFLMLFTLTSFFGTIGERDFFLGIKVLLAWSMYTFFVSILWKKNSLEHFMNYATNVAVISTALLIIQFIAVSFGFLDFYDGRLPLFALSEYDSWAGLTDYNTGDIRVHSFFQEPSYFGIYCLPVLARLLRKEKFKVALFVSFGLILTSSLVAILGGLVVMLIIIITEKNPLKKSNLNFWRKIMFIIGLSAIIAYSLYLTNNSVREVVDYSLIRASNIINELQSDRMGSAKLRLLGYASYFEEYPLYFKFFGVGASQYPLYLSRYNVLAYSSTIVTILLNYGILGITFFSLWIVNLYAKCPPKLRIYLIIFVIISSVDYFWFSWYFFYILTWFLPHLNTKNRKEGKNYE